MALVQVPWVAMLPWMSSMSDVMVRASGPMLLTTTLNWKVPPGSGRLVGLADFSTMIAGTTLVMVTVASSEAVAELSSSSTAMAVTMSVCWAPALPLKCPVNEQL